ncbi:hypothetical protein [Micromonospora sp. NPDC005113]
MSPADAVKRTAAQDLRDAVMSMAIRYASSSKNYAYALADGYHPDERARLLRAEQRRFKALQRLTWALANLATKDGPR